MGSLQGSPGRGGLGLLVFLFFLLLSPVRVSSSRGRPAPLAPPGGEGGSGGRPPWVSGFPPRVSLQGGGGEVRTRGGGSPRCLEPAVSREGKRAEEGGCPVSRQLRVRPVGSGRRETEAWYRRVLSPVGLSLPFSPHPATRWRAGRRGDTAGPPCQHLRRESGACSGSANFQLLPSQSLAPCCYRRQRRQLPGMPRSCGVLWLCNARCM